MLEFIIAFAINTIIIIGTIKIYLILLNNQRQTLAVSNLQHKSQLAFLILKKNIILAGQSTCLKENSRKNINPIIVNSSSAIQKKPNTDMLQIQRCLFISNKIQWTNIKFFIRNTHRKTINHTDIFSLYQKIGNNRSKELIADIYHMKVCYITSQYNQRLRCLRENEIKEAKNIQGVHIELWLNPSRKIFITGKFKYNNGIS